ncbi:MAG: hypothetical protein JGK32_22595 [Microcoleus sp. PH2017_31_RDM_U_A]|nr:hypothetical protein [Microcoleus sp. PH2017_31_RDM_U_A]
MAISYNPNYFVPFHTIGGPGGTAFSWIHGTNGNLIKKLEVWVGPSQIRGIKVTLTNGQSQIFGKLEDRNAGSIEFAPGERINNLSIWGNGAGTRCGAFKMVTSKGQTFFPKMYSWGLKTEYVMDVGSGLLSGIFGRASLDIDALGFAFLLPYKGSVLKEVKYPDLDADLVATTPFMLDQVLTDNLQGAEVVQITLSGSQKLTAHTEWSNSTAIEVAISSTVQAGIPMVADVEVGTTVTVGNVYTYNRSTTEEVTRSVDIILRVPPGQKVKHTATTYQDKIDTRYEGRLEVIMQNGAIFSYPVTGIYKGVSARSVFIKTELLETAREFDNGRAENKVLDAKLEGQGKLVNQDLNEHKVVRMF